MSSYVGFNQIASRDTLEESLLPFYGKINSDEIKIDDNACIWIKVGIGVYEKVVTSGLDKGNVRGYNSDGVLISEKKIVLESELPKEILNAVKSMLTGKRIEIIYDVRRVDQYSNYYQFILISEKNERSYLEVPK